MSNLPNNFYVQFKDLKCVRVNNKTFVPWGNENLINSLSIDSIKNNFPSEVAPENVFGISWNLNDPTQTGFNMDNGAFISFEPNEENFNKYCKPYADIWQEIKDKIEQEQEEIEKEYNKFENRQKRALTQLNQDFEDVKERAYIKSSLGFTSDADSVANENITGLLLTIGDNTIQFCDYHNEFHTLNKSQLTTLQNEIIQNAQSLYAQKWQFRTAIKNATDNNTLDQAISQINFIYMSFKQE